MQQQSTGFVASDLEGTLTTGETWRGPLRLLRQWGEHRAVRFFLARKLPAVPLAREGAVHRGPALVRVTSERGWRVRGKTNGGLPS